MKIITIISATLLFANFSNGNAMDVAPQNEPPLSQIVEKKLYPPVKISSRDDKLIRSIKVRIDSRFPSFSQYFSFSSSTDQKENFCYVTLPHIFLTGLLNNCIIPFIMSDVSQFRNKVEFSMTAGNIVAVTYSPELEESFTTSLRRAKISNCWFIPKILQWDIFSIDRYDTSESLFNLVFHETKLKGFILGENHRHRKARQWLIEHMDTLVKNYEVEILYIEHFPKQLQPLMDQYMADEKGLMPLDLSNQCDLLSLLFGNYGIDTDGKYCLSNFSYKDVLLAAKKAGIKKIVAIDDVSMAFSNLKMPKNISDRCLLVNHLFKEMYNPEVNSLTLCGLNHAINYEHPDIDCLVYGLSAISGLPIIDLSWEHTTELMFPK